MARNRNRNNQRNNQTVEPNRSKRYLILIWGVIGGIGLISGILANWEPIKKMFLTQHESYENEKFVTGDLKLPKNDSVNKNTGPHFNSSASLSGDFKRKSYSILNEKPFFPTPSFDRSRPLIKGIWLKGVNKTDVVFVFISGYLFTCFKEDLEQGIDIFNPAFKDCIATHLYLALKGERLFVSVEFKDLLKEETIGVIEYNHWRLYVPNMFDFKNDDERLEVLDKQHNIVFSIVQAPKDELGVFISGYFIGPKSIVVMPNNPKKSKSANPICIDKADPLWKAKALEEIELIKTIF